MVAHPPTPRGKNYPTGKGLQERDDKLKRHQAVPRGSLKILGTSKCFQATAEGQECTGKTEKFILPSNANPLPQPQTPVAAHSLKPELIFTAKVKKRK